MFPALFMSFHQNPRHKLEFLRSPRQRKSSFRYTHPRNGNRYLSSRKQGGSRNHRISRRGRPAWGKIIEIFGEADTFGAAYSAILYDNDIIIEFPADVEEEARRISARPVTAEGRLDLRGKNIFTIQSPPADLDDAISIEAGQGRLYFRRSHRRASPNT